MQNVTPLELARTLYAENLAPIPIHAGTKRPATKWKRFQTTGPDAQQLPLLFERDNITVGVLCGAASDRLLVLDCDNAKAFGRALAALKDPDTHIIQTGRKGGAHIYVRTPVPVKTTRIDGLDAKAQGAYVLAPGAMHPSGVRYKWMHRAPTIYELPSLDVIPWLHLEPAPTYTPGLPGRAFHLLTNVHAVRENGTPYHSHSEREFAAMCALVNAAWDFTRVLGAFEQFAKYGHFADKVRTNGSAKAREWLLGEYTRARAWTAAHDSNARQIANAQRAWAMSQTWTGRTGAYDRDVYAAHCAIAARAGKLEYGASARELAEIAGVSKEAANKASHRLVRAELITLTSAAKQGEMTPHLWKLHPARNLYIPSHWGGNECIGFAQHDLFRWNGLGKTGADIWRVLSAGDTLHTKTIAERTAHQTRTVRKMLYKMFRLGMIVLENAIAETWTAAPDVNLDEIARKLGSAGTARKQKETHKRQRAARFGAKGGAA